MDTALQHNPMSCGDCFFRNAGYPKTFSGIIAQIGMNDILSMINPLGEERLYV